MISASARIVRVELDPASLAAASADAEHERRVAIYDLLEANRFALEGAHGPYQVHLSTAENRLVFDIRDASGAALRIIALSLSPLRRVVRDYFIVCESYYQAIRTATPHEIEAVDMGRRGLHDEGSALLAERLKGKVEMDHDTARRLFTLICALYRPR